jgi:hypothetical protein
MPLIRTFTGRSAFWDQTHPLFEQQTELWEKLIPANGEASTEHGELLRIFSNLINDIFGDGLSSDHSEGLIYIYERRSKYRPFLKMGSIFLLSQIIEAQNHYKKYETEALIVNQSFCDRLDDQKTGIQAPPFRAAFYFPSRLRINSRITSVLVRSCLPQ